MPCGEYIYGLLVIICGSVRIPEMLHGDPRKDATSGCMSEAVRP